jgi:SAM-dependent methyltransferase
MSIQIAPEASKQRGAVAAPCPVCAGPSAHQMPAPGGEMRRCLSDGLVFAWPLSLPAAPSDLFADAYTGRVDTAEMRMFHHRLLWRADLLAAGAAAAPVMAEVHRRASSYIRETTPAGSPVLDIGCGSGLFLETMRRAGYEAHGVEVAGPVVDFLHKNGFDVFHGTVEEVPGSRFDPVVATAFFVLHHVTDPMGFLSTIRAKFPRARLALTEHFFGEDPKKLASLNLPPRRLTAWNPRSLRLALESSGYAVKSLDIVQAEPYHPVVDSPLMGLYCRLRGVMPAFVRPRLITGYIRAKRAAFGLLSKAFGPHPLLVQEHLIAIAEPE